MTNSKTMTNQDKMYDELVELRDQLECMEDDNDSVYNNVEYVLEHIFVILDSMRGGYDMTEEAVICIEEAKYIINGNKIILK